MTNEQLVIRIKAGIDVGENMSLLYEQMKDFISYMVRRCGRGYEDAEDLEQEGFLALYDAVDGFDPDKGFCFITYASRWIRQRISRYIAGTAHSIRLPVYALEHVKQYQKVVREYQRDHGRKPLIGEISAQMGLSIDQVRQIIKDAAAVKMASLDSPIGEDGENTLQDMLPGSDNIEECVCDQVELEQLQAAVWSVVDSLPGECPQVIRLRYQQGLTALKAADLLGMQPMEVKSIENIGLRKLRKPERADRLRPFLYEEPHIRSRALRGNGAKRFSQTWTSSTERIAMELAE